MAKQLKLNGLSAIVANSLSSASEQIVPSVGAVAGRKPRAEKKSF